MKKLLLILMAGAMALMAETTTARGYLERAEKLEAKAVKHDANAEEMASGKSFGAMRYKWPSMLQGKIIREQNLAMQARRAASEARELAAKAAPTRPAGE